MRWDQGHESDDLIDRRGQRGVRGGGLGGILPFVPMLIRSPFGWVILLGLIGYSFYQSGFFGGVGGGASPAGGQPARVADGPKTVGVKDDRLKHFVAFVLDDAQATWTRELQATPRTPYRRSKLVLFEDTTDTGCGYGDAATGPFYCPADERVYIDLGFYRELSDRLGAKGEFAQAYVIAHEIGHHVQKILGTSKRVRALRGRSEGADGPSVRLELQADCYAGIWAHSTAERNLLESGDIDSALSAASAIGDDRLQRAAKRAVSPETWTHGSSAQRVKWFRVGYERGSVQACDTFAANAP